MKPISSDNVLLATEIFFDLREAQILIQASRRHYNHHHRPRSSLGYRPRAPTTVLPAVFMLPYYGK
ncbi:MAG: hypothetical protein DBW63_00200 [Hyphomonas sp.]|nr:MAG: hypothetical protein DBW63_00200 [Hyphomonas sp.]